jgi:phosphate transport system permease protein
METLFRNIARLSASFVLVILLSTVVVLYHYAKPAIDEFGLHFITDSRWGVDIPINQPDSAKSNPDSLTADLPSGGSDIPSSNAGTDSSSANDSVDTGDQSLDQMDSGDDYIPTDSDFVQPEGGASQTKTVYGGAVPIVGSLMSIAIAMLFSIPVALGISVYLSEIAPPLLVKPVGIAIELLAAIPSIIYGMWALFYFGPMVSHFFGGHSVSLLVAGLVLGVMVIPFMAALSRDAINTTPDVLKESAYSMGATKFDVIKDVIFPYAKAGIVGSIIVSFGRAIGETMAVAFVIGGVFDFASKVTDPTNSIPVVLANNFSESSGMSMSVLYYLALILFVVSFSIIFLAKYFLLRRKSI